MINIITKLLEESAYLFTSFIMLIIIFFIDIKLGIGITIVCLLSLYYFKIDLKKSKVYLKKEYNLTDKYSTIINETSKGISDIKALNFEEKCYNFFQKDIEGLKENRTKRRIVGVNVNVLKWTTRTLFEILLFIYIINLLINGVISTDTAVILVTYMNNIIDDLFHRLIEHDFGIAEFTANMKRVSEILEDKEGKEIFGIEEHNKINGKVDIQNLKYKYNNSKDYVLKDINISLKPNSLNAIVGLSGEGKSTIFKILLKEFDNYEGTILFDDININKFSKESFRNTISIVNQEPVLFNMSIKDNLLMSNTNATMEDIIKCCKIANINDFIEELPNKYNEIVTENSNNFSVGQKQRIAIARAILRNTPIILFDEATSALDNYSRIKIKEIMKELSKTKTIIVISHTIDMIKDCDNIL